jgi:hypothetical protein
MRKMFKNRLTHPSINKEWEVNTVKKLSPLKVKILHGQMMQDQTHTYLNHLKISTREQIQLNRLTLIRKV